MKSILSTLLAAATATALLAQAQPTINQRKKAQQERVAAGVASGELTPAEAAKIENKEAKLNQEIRKDRVDGGKMTAAERAKIHKQQNALSTDIAAQKHDGQKTNFKGEVGERQARQQKRIAAGIADGTVKPGEAAKLEAGEAAINHQVKAERKANGGKLTKGERKAVNAEQNAASGAIRDAKQK